MQEELFQQYAYLVHQRFGIQLPPEKKSLLESRLFKLLNNHLGEPGFGDEEEFLRYLGNDASGRAMGLLAEAITTHHTFFMREADHFDFFGQQVLPYLAESIRDGDVRTWCAACSSGEESYTMAMVMAEFFALRGPGWETTLLATDLSKDILEVARSGIYEDAAVATLPDRWKAQFFHRLPDGRWQISDLLKQRVLYRQFNLMRTAFPFRKPFHVIFCRNVMIYFDAATRDALVRKFYDYLEPGGFLFVGHSEVVDRQSAPFQYVMPSVYRKAP